MTGPVTPDGCPVELYTLVPPYGEAEIVHAAVPPTATILELGCGTGRIMRPLAALGHEVTGVDESAEMLSHVGDLPTVLTPIETADLGRTFDAVLLASHLINTGDEDQRPAFLATARRHVDDAGTVIIQWQPPEWFDSAGDSQHERDGISYHLHSLRRDGPLLHAAVTYRAGAQSWTHEFTSRRLTEPELHDALAGAGLRFDRWLTDDRRWLGATVAQRPAQRSAEDQQQHHDDHHDRDHTGHDQRQGRAQR